MNICNAWIMNTTRMDHPVVVPFLLYLRRFRLPVAERHALPHTHAPTQGFHCCYHHAPLHVVFVASGRQGQAMRVLVRGCTVAKSVTNTSV